MSVLRFSSFVYSKNAKLNSKNINLKCKLQKYTTYHYITSNIQIFICYKYLQNGSNYMDFLTKNHVWWDID